MNKLPLACLAASLSISGCDIEENPKTLCYGSEKTLPAIASQIYTTIPTLYTCEPADTGSNAVIDLGLPEHSIRTEIFNCQLNNLRQVLQCAQIDQETFSCNFAPVINNKPDKINLGNWTVGANNLTLSTPDNIASISVDGENCTINGEECLDPHGNCLAELETDRIVIQGYINNLFTIEAGKTPKEELPVIESPLLHSYD